ncbi:unnamed protein product [Ectocarpus sp. 6 AP-2014]
MDAYEKLEKIGEGAYGTVYKAKIIRTGEVVALKKVKLQEQDEGVSSTTMREISLLRELCRHPCVVSLHDIQYATTDVLYMVFEYMDQDLKKYLDGLARKGQQLSPQIIKSYLYQLLHAVRFCHSNRILHRDLKPQNILIDAEGNLKLADFGLARVFTVSTRQYTHEVVTLWYRPPEILLGCDYYGTSADIWSVGCILAELSNLDVLFRGNSEIDQLFKIFQSLGTPGESVWQGVTSMTNYSTAFPRFVAKDIRRRVPRMEAEGAELLRQMLVYEPGSRITCAQALQLPYFLSVNPRTAMHVAGQRSAPSPP